MNSLTADEILQIWDRGQNLHPIDRALTILAVAMPDRSSTDLARLSIGARDSLLMELRSATVGERLESVVCCPNCGEELELAMKAGDLGFGDLVLPIDPEYRLDLEEFAVQFHLPTSYDLAAVVGCSDLETATQRLLQSCIVGIERSDEQVEIESLPEETLAQIADRMATIDPRSEIILAPICPACEHSWQVLFDIVTFFWTELTVRAQQLMREVAILARAYGWREADILAMSPVRRQYYLDLVA